MFFFFNWGMYKTDGRFEKLHAPQFISGEPEKQRVGRLGGNRCSFACTQRLRPCDHNQEPEKAENRRKLDGTWL